MAASDPISPPREPAPRDEAPRRSILRRWWFWAIVVVPLVSNSRTRRTDELLGRAEIRATSVAARPGDALLDELAAL